MTRPRGTLWQSWRPALRASVTALALMSASLPAEAARPCMSTAEASAEEVRALQSGLMVAALKCVHKPQLYLDRSYEQFVQRFQPELRLHANQLISYFKRAYGNRYNNYLDAHVTNLANQFSLLTFRDDYFCESMAELAAHVLTVSPERMRDGQFDAELLRVKYARICIPEPLRTFRPALADSNQLHADFPNEAEVDGDQPNWYATDIAQDTGQAIDDGGTGEPLPQDTGKRGDEAGAESPPDGTAETAGAEGTDGTANTAVPADAAAQ